MATESADQKNILVKVRFLQPTLTKSERRAADLLLNDPQHVTGLTLVEFAQEADCGQATVVRFCRRLDLYGFSELKKHLRAELASGRIEPACSDIEVEDSVQDIMRKVFEASIGTLRDTLALNANCEGALDALVNAGKVALFGLGDAVIPCQLAYIKFLRLGMTCYMHTDADLQLTTAVQLGPGDVAMAVSHSGRTACVVEAVRLAKQGGATTMCITKYQRSPLADLCDFKFYTATMDPTVGREIVARRTAEQAILESLYLGVLMRRGEQATRHLHAAAQAVQANKIH